jgi:transcriptional regulator with XRE-family HTH domain
MLRQEFVFGKFLADARKEKGLRPIQLARIAGYKNTNKFIRRLQILENGNIDEDFANKVMLALGVTAQDRNECYEKEPIAVKKLLEGLPEFIPFATQRLMPAIYANLELPGKDFGEENLLEFVKLYATKRNKHCCLHVNYNLRFWVSGDGHIYRDTTFGRGMSASPDIGKLL